MHAAALLRAAQPAATDADLLARFAAGRDEAAFAELVRRHAGLVRDVARRVTGDPHAADDATQAVFLLLARKAAAGGWGTTVGPWLYRVACRVAAKARARAARRAVARVPDDVPAPPADPAANLAWADVRAALDAALAALPARLRDPLVLCYLEGLTRDEAATALGCTVTAVKGRVARGRDRLRRALAARGLSLPAGLAAVLAGDGGVSAGAAAELARTAAVHVTTGAVPPAVRPLLRGAAGGWAPTAALAGLLVACGVVALAAAGPAQNPPAPNMTPPAAAEAIPLGSADLRHPAVLTELRFTPDGKALVSYGHGVIRHWDARTGRPLPVHTTDVTPNTAWSFATADGAAVVAVHVEFTAPYRHTVRRHDAATGRHVELFVLPERRNKPGQYAQGFTLSGDGGLLAATDDSAVTVWDLATRRPRFMIEPPGKAFALQFTPDGKQVVTAGRDGRTVRFWDASTGKEVRSVTRAGGRLPQSNLNAVAISPDGRRVAASDNSHLIDHGTEVTVWDLDRPGRPHVLTVPEGVGHSGNLVFGPDGTLFTATDPFERWLSVVSRWDVASGEWVVKWDGPKPDWRGGLVAAVSPDGSALAVGTYAGAIRLYDAKTGKELVAGGGHAARVAGVEFDAAGAEVRTTAEDGSVATWDARTGAARARRGPPDVDRTGDSTAAVLSRDGRWLLTHGNRPRDDGRRDVTVWDAATAEKRFTGDVIGQVKELLPIPGGTLIVGQVDLDGGNALQAVQVWDTANGIPLPVVQRTFHRHRVQFAVTAAGPTLVACDEESVAGYDPRTGKERFAWKLADSDVLPKAERSQHSVRAVAASPDGKTLAVAVAGPAYLDPGKRTHALVLVEARTGRVIRRTPTPEVPPVWLVFSPDGRRLAGPRGVWDAATLAELRRFPARPEVTAAAFSPDGSRAATGYANGTAQVWPLGPG